MSKEITQVLDKLMDDTDFKKEFNILQRLLSSNESLGCSNRLVGELEIAPSNVYHAGKLLVVAKWHLKEMNRLYEMEMLAKEEVASKELNRKKINKLITRQITESMIKTKIINENKEWYETWQENLNDQEQILKLCEIMYKSFEFRISTLQSIGKQIAERDKANMSPTGRQKIR